MKLSITEPKRKTPPTCSSKCNCLSITEGGLTCLTCTKFGKLNTRPDRSGKTLPIRKEKCKHTII